MSIIFEPKAPFILESGKKLNNLKIAYQTWGNPSSEKIVWVCHALSGNSDVFEWWSGLFGENKPFNENEFFIVCANVLGSCYGTTGPADLDEPKKFPFVSIRDLVKAHQLLAAELKINKIDYLIGPSLGGQQAVDWAIQDAEKIKNLILIATNAYHSAYGRAFNESQRLALEADLTFGLKGGGQFGLAAARGIAMLSYRSYEDFTIKQSDEEKLKEGFKAASYIRYQGEKFIKRFEAHAYYALTKVMDSHDVGVHAANRKEALAKITARTLVVGVDSDLLFPLSEQEFLANNIDGATLKTLSSPYGHDAFLIEFDQLNTIVLDFLEQTNKKCVTSLKTTIYKTAI